MYFTGIGGSAAQSISGRFALRISVIIKAVFSIG